MTTRGVIISLLCVIFLSIATPYSDLVMRGTWIGLTSFPISSFVVFFFWVTVINIILRKLNLGLSSDELMLIYCMTLVAAGIPSFGLTGVLIPHIAGPVYFAGPENNWQEIILKHLPGWMVLKDNPEAVRYLYEGLPKGMSIPWLAWLRPLLFFSLLVLCIYLVMFCAGTLLRKQWIDNEKLVFPLTYLPVELAKNIKSFLSDKIMWCFFALPFFIHILNGLRFYIPVIPSINVHMIDLRPYLTEHPWNTLPFPCVRILFSIIGLTYLIPTSVSFSLCFFYFFFVVQQLIAATLGFPMKNVHAFPVREFVAHQMIGGIIIFAIISLWIAKDHLKNVLSKVFTKKSTVDDSNEPMSYRTAFFGLLVGMFLISLWGRIAGASFIGTFILFLLYILVHIVAVRLVCEGGMLYVQHPFRPWNIFLATLGSAAIGPVNIAIFTFFDTLFMLDNRSPMMPCLMQTFKIVDATKIRKRKLTIALICAILISMVVSYCSYLTLMYKFGGINLHLWFTTYYTYNLYSMWTSHLIVSGEPANPMALLGMGIGGLTMWFLMFMHKNFLWWPFHPIGYLMGASWPMLNFWFSILIGWFIKSIILKFGGITIYKRLMPGFIGLILAEFLSAGLWVIINFFTGVREHTIFTF